jgi:hypothetical protein
LRKKMQLRDSKTPNLGELQQDMTKLWVLKMGASRYLKNLVESMTRRLQGIMRREGNPTKACQRSCIHSGPF